MKLDTSQYLGFFCFTSNRNINEIDKVYAKRYFKLMYMAHAYVASTI